jgi:hypothetical protein
MTWEVEISDGAMMYPGGARSREEAVEMAEFILAQQDTGRRVVGVRPASDEVAEMVEQLSW